MGLPTKKLTKSSARRRASHFALKKASTTKCKNCGAIILPHRACNKCGYYKGEKKVATKSQINKK
ncbi:MAG: 50S ribosomal protein L32 [Patescibacteria group bacterium]|jgi:large subunit ribosomal protein L32